MALPYKYHQRINPLFLPPLNQKKESFCFLFSLSLSLSLTESIGRVLAAMGRTPCCDKGNVKRGAWSIEEDALLKNYIQKYGTGGNWITLPKKAGDSFECFFQVLFLTLFLRKSHAFMVLFVMISECFSDAFPLKLPIACPLVLPRNDFC